MSEPDLDLIGAVLAGNVKIDVIEFLKGMGKGDFDVLGWLGDEWSAGDDDSLIGAVAYCSVWHEPLPPWAVLGILDVLVDNGRRRRDGSKRRERRHSLRWYRVQRLRKLPKDKFKLQFGQKRNLPNIWQAVAEQLTADGDRTTDEAVRKSYQIIERANKKIRRYRRDEVGPKTSLKSGP
jgi:hypothetical protein